MRMFVEYEYPMLMSLTVFGGSLEFVAVTMLLAPFAPVQTFMLTLMIQAGHLFYEISMLDKFRGMVLAVRLYAG